MPLDSVVAGAPQKLPAVQLRPLGSSDLADVHALLSNWEIVRYMLLPICSEEDSGKFLRDAIEDAHPAWRSIVRAIVEPGGGKLAGLCGIAILRGSEEGEIWYLLDPRFRGCGFAAGAAARLIDIGFADLGLHRVWACCLPENPASARVLERVGMRFEGLRRRNLKIHGEWKDSLLYAIVADEWRGEALARSASSAISDNIALVLQFTDRLINRGDAAAADELLAPAYMDHSAAADQAPGPEGVKATYARVRQVFEGMNASAEDIIAEGDRVVVRHAASAMRSGSDRRLQWTAISIYRVAGGKIAERWGLTDIPSEAIRSGRE